MSLAPGTRLGPYEIVSLLGAGGMGEVYKALDGRLDRTVAIKVLPAHLSASPELKQRLDREARIISQLAHPHVCALFDLGHHDGIDYFVMEILEGETLAARLTRGALPLPEVRRFGAQIADALDAAHRQGVIHRDLKPANVMLTRAGVKLLDFGIAKPMPSESTGSDATRLAPALTEEGMVLGTAQYMSPEQIEGGTVTASSDLFAFGTLLYEMITGRPPFAGASRTALLAAILEGDPQPVSSIVPASAGVLDAIVGTCLKKDPLDRWQSAHDVAIQLRSISETGSQTANTERLPSSKWLTSSVVSLTGWAVAAMAVVTMAALQLRAPAPVRTSAVPKITFPMPPPTGRRFYVSGETSQFALSPDGSQLAYLTTGPAGVTVWMRTLADLEGGPLLGTENARTVFWSPDGRSIAFVDGTGKLKRIDPTGGSAVTICDVPTGIGVFGSWGRDGQIIFATVEGDAIYRVSTSGGVPEALVKPDAAKGERRVSWPWFLPDGRRYLYLARHGYDGSVMLSEPGKPPREVLKAISNIQYVEPGYLVFVRDGSLVMQPFDLEKGEISGEPVALAESIGYSLSTGSAQFATSLSGSIVFQQHRNAVQPTWFDRTGRQLGTLGLPGDYSQVRFSPDGRTVAFGRAQPRLGTDDLWTFDLGRGIETRLTSEVGSESAPVWLPDGSAIVFLADRGAPPHLFRKDMITGAERELLPGSRLQQPLDVTRDGSTVIYGQRTARGNNDLLTLGPSGKPENLFVSPFDEFDARLSPDGRFVAVATDESGAAEVYVSAFPPAGAKIRISVSGGFAPRWSSDGRELFYREPSGDLKGAPIRVVAGRVEAGTPLTLFRPVLPMVGYEVSSDGRILMLVVTELGSQQPLTVVVNALK